MLKELVLNSGIILLILCLEAGFNDDNDIQELCYETLKDLLPGSGAKFLIQRSKVWKLIKKSLEASDTASNANSGSLNTQFCTPPRKDMQKEEVVVIENMSSPSRSLSSPKLVLKSPEYTVYKDNDLDVAASSGEIPYELRHRLIRSTVSNMQAAAYSPPFNRRPNNAELNEMAKSLVLTYPSLADPDTGHGLLFKQLQKRLYNLKPVKKRSEKNVETEEQKETPEEKKGKKRSILEIKEETKVKCSKNDSTTISSQKHDILPEIDASACKDSVSNVSKSSYDKEMMVRHYNAMLKECKKSKPNAMVLNQYLNKEFVCRRKWLKTTSAQSRCKEVLNAYPCFRNHVEIVEEVRRSLGITENKGYTEFLNECCQKLEIEIETIVYYGLCVRDTKSPKSPSINSKIIFILQNLCSIFPSKKAPKKSVNIIDFLEDNQDPEQWLIHRRQDTPVIVLSSGEALLIVGKVLVSSLDRSNLKEALLGLIGLFYLLDLDYPSTHEMGFTMLHYLIFGDKSVSAAISKPFNVMLTEYVQFKDSKE